MACSRSVGPQPLKPRVPIHSDFSDLFRSNPLVAVIQNICFLQVISSIGSACCGSSIYEMIPPSLSATSTYFALLICLSRINSSNLLSCSSLPCDPIRLLRVDPLVADPPKNLLSCSSLPCDGAAKRFPGAPALCGVPHPPKICFLAARFHARSAKRLVSARVGHHALLGPLAAPHCLLIRFGDSDAAPSLNSSAQSLLPSASVRLLHTRSRLRTMAWRLPQPLSYNCVGTGGGSSGGGFSPPGMGAFTPQCASPSSLVSLIASCTVAPEHTSHCLSLALRHSGNLTNVALPFGLSPHKHSGLGKWTNAKHSRTYRPELCLQYFILIRSVELLPFSPAPNV